MTFSIVARCERTGQMGAAVATAMHAVGKLASHVKTGAGAVMTQANLNPYFGYDGLRLLAQKRSAKDTLDALLSQDMQPEHRQVGVLDASGGAANWSGKEIFDWAGDSLSNGFSAQGNRLVGPEVLEAVVDSMENTSEKDLVERLLLALEAGVAAGGDREGERSANIYVVGDEEYPLWDIRVDDRDTPLEEVRRLYHLFQESLLPQIENMPKRKDYPRVK